MSGRIWNLMALCLVWPTVAHAQLLFDERFDKKEWSTSGYAHYVAGQYHIRAQEGRMVYYDGRKFDDFDLEVKTEFIDGNDNKGYGVMFRTKDYDNYYEFSISGTGYIRIGGELKDKWFEIVPWETTTAIRKSGVNFVRVSCKGDLLSCYVNGALVKEVRDMRHRSGYVGLTAYSDAHIHFDDLRVYAFGTMPKSDYVYDDPVPADSFDYASDAGALHIENFIDKSGNWSETDFAHYEAGFYKMYDTKEVRYSWQNGSQTDVDYEARLRLVEWPKSGIVGITLRITDSKNYYGFFLTQDGKYYFERCVEGSTNRLIMPTALSFDPSSVLTLGMTMAGGKFTLKLNGQTVANTEDPDVPLRSGNFGFYTSKGVGAEFLAVRLSLVPFSWKAFWLDPERYVPAAVLAGLVLVISLWVMRNRRKRRKLSNQQRVTQTVDMIRAGQGTLSLGDLMMKYKISKRAALDLMDTLVADYGGIARVTIDGGLEYDFPDFMPSEEKLRHDILQLAAQRKGRVTVTETAQHLKKEIVETETMLDLMVDNKRVRKVEEDGITYYEFVEIRRR